MSSWPNSSHYETSSNWFAEGTIHDPNFAGPAGLELTAAGTEREWSRYSVADAHIGLFALGVGGPVFLLGDGDRIGAAIGAEVWVVLD